MALNESECNMLAELLKRAEWPLSKEVFHALMGVVVTTPIELGVFDAGGKILLIHRDDPEYPDCWHLPGTVLRNNEDVPTAVKRLINGEVRAPVLDLISLGWREIVKGSGVGQNPTRHEISLVHVCWLQGSYEGVGKFFSLDSLPESTLTHHRVLIQEMMERFHVFGN